MDSFASVTDMEQRSQGEITATSQPFLTKELAAASEAIRGECGWHIAGVEVLTYRRTSRFPNIVFLPAMRIHSVLAVTVNGVVLDLGTVEWDENTGETNIIGRSVEIVYSAGFSAVPADLQLLTLELAAAGLGTSLGFSKEQAGSVSYTYTRTAGLTAADSPRLAPYRLGYLP